MTPPYPKPGKKPKTIGQRSRKQVDDITDMLFLRDDYRCVVSGIPAAALDPCQGNITRQHRVGKGMGGSAQFDSPAHLITMCLFHNLLEPRDAAFAQICHANGWSLPRGAKGVDPAVIPVRYWDGWYVLDADTCDRTPIDDFGAGLRMARVI